MAGTTADRESSIEEDGMLTEDVEVWGQVFFRWEDCQFKTTSFVRQETAEPSEKAHCNTFQGPFQPG